MEEKYRHAVEETVTVEEHPNLRSELLLFFMESFVLTGWGCLMMQARFAVPDWQLPEDCGLCPDKSLQRPPKPYTLCQNFGILMRDYIGHSQR